MRFEFHGFDGLDSVMRKSEEDRDAVSHALAGIADDLAKMQRGLDQIKDRLGSLELKSKAEVLSPLGPHEDSTPDEPPSQQLPPIEES